MAWFGRRNDDTTITDGNEKEGLSSWFGRPWFGGDVPDLDAERSPEQHAQQLASVTGEEVAGTEAEDENVAWLAQQEADGVEIDRANDEQERQARLDSHENDQDLAHRHYEREEAAEFAAHPERFQMTEQDIYDRDEDEAHQENNWRHYEARTLDRENADRPIGEVGKEPRNQDGQTWAEEKAELEAEAAARAQVEALRVQEVKAAAAERAAAAAAEEAEEAAEYSGAGRASRIERAAGSEEAVTYDSAALNADRTVAVYEDEGRNLNQSARVEWAGGSPEEALDGGAIPAAVVAAMREDLAEGEWRNVLDNDVILDSEQVSDAEVFVNVESQYQGYFGVDGVAGFVADWYADQGQPTENTDYYSSGSGEGDIHSA
jgi:hypothetical protein